MRDTSWQGTWNQVGRHGAGAVADYSHLGLEVGGGE